MTLGRKFLGESGEDIACEYLQSKGFEILERNFRCKLGEIDIIAKLKIKNQKSKIKNLKSKILSKFKNPKEVVIFVEVKAKTGTGWGSPEEMVNKKKQDKIIKCAQYYLKTRNYVDSHAEQRGIPHKSAYSLRQSAISWRIDVVAIEYDELGEAREIRHIENAVMR